MSWMSRLLAAFSPPATPTISPQVSTDFSGKKVHFADEDVVDSPGPVTAVHEPEKWPEYVEHNAELFQTQDENDLAYQSHALEIDLRSELPPNIDADELDEAVQLKLASMIRQLQRQQDEEDEQDEFEGGEQFYPDCSLKPEIHQVVVPVEEESPEESEEEEPAPVLASAAPKRKRSCPSSPVSHHKRTRSAAIAETGGTTPARPRRSTCIAAQANAATVSRVSKPRKPRPSAQAKSTRD